MGIVDRITSLFQGFNWVIIPAALLAIVFHEISHGYVAYLMGDNTAKGSSRLSVNPMKHLDPLGLICMILFGFGWAKPVPVNPYYFKNKKLGIILVSLAGPLSNVIMAIVYMIAALLVVRIDVSNDVVFYVLEVVVQFCLASVSLNIGLAVFNIIPIPPLDGSKILFAVLPSRAYRFVLNYERYGMLILLVLINVPWFLNILSSLRGGLLDLIVQLVYPIIY